MRYLDETSIVTYFCVYVFVQAQGDVKKKSIWCLRDMCVCVLWVCAAMRTDNSARVRN